jgi:hypothetical protein
MISIIDSVEERGELILPVVDDKPVDTLAAVASHVLGELMAPDTGVMFFLDIERAIGVRDHRTQVIPKTCKQSL